MRRMAMRRVILGALAAGLVVGACTQQQQAAPTAAPQTVAAGTPTNTPSIYVPGGDGSPAAPVPTLPPTNTPTPTALPKVPPKVKKGEAAVVIKGGSGEGATGTGGAGTGSGGTGSGGTGSGGTGGAGTGGGDTGGGTGGGGGTIGTGGGTGGGEQIGAAYTFTKPAPGTYPLYTVGGLVDVYWTDGYGNTLEIGGNNLKEGTFPTSEDLSLKLAVIGGHVFASGNGSCDITIKRHTDREFSGTFRCRDMPAIDKPSVRVDAIGSFSYRPQG
jgi:hypothetical protein